MVIEEKDWKDFYEMAAERAKEEGKSLPTKGAYKKSVMLFLRTLNNYLRETPIDPDVQRTVRLPWLGRFTVYTKPEHEKLFARCSSEQVLHRVPDRRKIKFATAACLKSALAYGSNNIDVEAEAEAEKEEKANDE